jgi:hypothetical protein
MDKNLEVKTVVGIPQIGEGLSPSGGIFKLMILISLK